MVVAGRAFVLVDEDVDLAPRACRLGTLPTSSSHKTPPGLVRSRLDDHGVAVDLRGGSGIGDPVAVQSVDSSAPFAAVLGKSSRGFFWVGGGDRWPAADPVTIATLSERVMTILQPFVV